MDSAYRSAVRNRKRLYAGLIAGLFLGSLIFRGIVSPTGATAAPAWTMRGQADRLDMTEQSLGESELTGSAVRLLLTGSRGLATCALWISANEKQVKQKWNEQELITRMIFKVQPHFLSPWLFQSWNISYNVSVVMADEPTVYFYIARGIQLLAEGDSLNRISPDMRYGLAFYYQSKFGIHDQVTTMRSLHALSCIPPEDRDPSQLMRGKQLDQAAFDAFTLKNPQFVHRLREKAIIKKDRNGIDQISYICSTPQQVVNFLAANRDLPGRYREAGVLKERLDQFPTLPPPFLVDPRAVLNPTLDIPDAVSDGYLSAHAWYRYANEVIPLPNPERKPEMDAQERDKYIPQPNRKMPKSPTLIIFRQGPPRSQTYYAERLQKDGWFDREPLKPDDRPETPWHKSGFTLPPSANSLEQWGVAFNQWDAHGRENGLWTEPRKVLEMERQAKIDPIERMKLQRMQRELELTQYKKFREEADAERRPDVSAVKKEFYLAERAERWKADRTEAIERYEVAIPKWKDLMNRNDLQDYRYSNDLRAEYTYTQNIRYMKLVAARDRLKYQSVTRGVHDWLQWAGRPLAGGAMSLAVDWSILADEQTVAGRKEIRVPALDSIEPMPLEGPFDGLDGRTPPKPWVDADIKERVRDFMGIVTKKPEPPATVQEPTPAP